jgi:hypothetical protein
MPAALYAVAGIRAPIASAAPPSPAMMVPVVNVAAAIATMRSAGSPGVPTRPSGNVAPACSNTAVRAASPNPSHHAVAMIPGETALTWRARTRRRAARSPRPRTVDRRQADRSREHRPRRRRADQRDRSAFAQDRQRGLNDTELRKELVLEASAQRGEIQRRERFRCFATRQRNDEIVNGAQAREES